MIKYYFYKNKKTKKDRRHNKTNSLWLVFDSPKSLAQKVRFLENILKNL